MESGKVVNSSRFISQNTPLNSLQYSSQQQNSLRVEDNDTQFLYSIKELLINYSSVKLIQSISDKPLNDFNFYWLLKLAKTQKDSISYIKYIFNTYKHNADITIFNHYKSILENITD